MLSKEEQERYSRQTVLPEWGQAGQERLKAASVLVIGAGGLGCPVLQYLTAAGVGTIGIADGDTIDISNLQRQVLYSETETGILKAEVAAKKLRALNPHVQLHVYPTFIAASNVLDILKSYDVIVDGSDNFATRYLVNDACVLLDKPMVSGAIYKFEGQVSVFNYCGGPTYRCLFPEPPGAGESPNCADIGVVATLPGIVGTIQANEVIKIITGIGDVLSGKLLVIDTLSMRTSTFNFKLNKANKQITKLEDLPEYCTIAATQISYDELQVLVSTRSVQLIDVRESEEHASDNIGGTNFPLSVFASKIDTLNPDDTIIVYCASGSRSTKAAQQLISHGFKSVLNLRGGIRGIQSPASAKHS